VDERLLEAKGAISRHCSNGQGSRCTFLTYRPPNTAICFLSFEEEFTYAFGGCTIIRGLDGSYLSRAGLKIPDRINLIYTDLPVTLSTNFGTAAHYADELKRVAFETLAEESVLVAIGQLCSL
jgi:hypothetical protein